MFLTKEGDYGLRIIRSLADGEMKTVEVICSSECIPGQFAYKILKKLSNAGIVQSIRGRNGGYRLAKDLHTFTLYDVIAAVEDNLLLFECLREDSDCPRNSDEDPCAVHEEYKRIQKLIEDETMGKTMDKIIIR